MSDFDNRDEEEKKETGLEENKGKEPSDKKEEKTDKPEKEYEDVCFICRRPESKAGKMYHLPNNICVCAVSYTHLDVYKRQLMYCG